ncbi:MAG: DUF503 domain-containing protein [Dehalococcoidia bacterium]
MHVAVCRLTLRLPGNRSLKGKRQIVRSLIDRVRHRYRVAIAEVGDQDRKQSAVIGVAAVSGEAAHASQVIERVVDYAETQFFDAEIIDVETDVTDWD